MKKYLQIAVVLGLFGALVLFRQLRGGDEQPVVGNQNSSLNINQNSTTQQSSDSGNSQPTPTTGSSSSTYKDGTYTGSVEDAYYGNIQVQATISGGKLTDVQFLQYPNDNRTSLSINTQAMPYLKQEALQAQSANVDIVSGASDSSQAFQRSLANALQQAQ